MRWLTRTTWPEVDERAAVLLRQPCLGVPSVRVGLCWVLEYLGVRRHADHVLVPRFMGRCILNSLNRHALPVEDQTPRTRVVVAVDQFGVRQNIAAIARECGARGLACIEDSPCGVGDDERPSRASIARLVGFSKALPIVQGAALLSSDGRLLDFVKTKRAVSTIWSWGVWLTMWKLRRRDFACGYSAAANAAYEMYVDGGGGNRWLRGNMERVLGHATSIEADHRARLAYVRDHMNTRVMMPDAGRLGYVVPYFPGDAMEQARSVFARHGFDTNPYHVDVNRNLFDPNYVQALLIPLNHRIPRDRFDALVDALAADIVPAGARSCSSGQSEAV